MKQELYEDDTVLMAESRYDLQHTRDQEGSESKYKEGERERTGV